MRSTLIFAAACACLVLTGLIVSKLTGSRAYYIEDWKFDPGENTLWRDDGADSYLITKQAQAQGTLGRLRRGFVVVTNQRILIGTMPLFGKKRMVQYVLYPAKSPDGQSALLDGGLLSKGYQTIVFQPGVVQRHLEEKMPYVDLTPMSGEASSTNVATIRVFTDLGATFRLP
jgi:hypothetical protein